MASPPAPNDAVDCYVGLCRSAGVECCLEVLAALTTEAGTCTLTDRATPLQDQDIRCIAGVLKRYHVFEALNVEGNEIGQDGVLYIANTLKGNTSLATLRLGANRFRDGGVITLAHALSANASLTSLDLSHNRIGGVGAKALAGLLREGSALEELVLHGNVVDAAGTEELARGLRHNETLKHLHLGYNDIGGRGVLVLAELVRENGALATLDVSNNRVGDAEGAALVETLIPTAAQLAAEEGHGAFLSEAVPPPPARVERLNLRSNLLGEKAFRALARCVVAEGVRLREVFVGHNAPPAGAVRELLEAASHSKCLRTLDLHGCPVLSAQPVAHLLTTNPHFTCLLLDGIACAPGAMDAERAIYDAAWARREELQRSGGWAAVFVGREADRLDGAHAGPAFFETVPPTAERSTSPAATQTQDAPAQPPSPARPEPVEAARLAQAAVTRTTATTTTTTATTATATSAAEGAVATLRSGSRGRVHGGSSSPAHVGERIHNKQSLLLHGGGAGEGEGYMPRLGTQRPSASAAAPAEAVHGEVRRLEARLEAERAEHRVQLARLEERLRHLEAQPPPTAAAAAGRRSPALRAPPNSTSLDGAAASPLQRADSSPWRARVDLAGRADAPYSATASATAQGSSAHADLDVTAHTHPQAPPSATALPPVAPAPAAASEDAGTSKVARLRQQRREARMEIVERRVSPALAPLSQGPSVPPPSPLCDAALPASPLGAPVGAARTALSAAASRPPIQRDVSPLRMADTPSGLVSTPVAAPSPPARLANAATRSTSAAAFTAFTSLEAARAAAQGRRARPGTSPPALPAALGGGVSTVAALRSAAAARDGLRRGLDAGDAIASAFSPTRAQMAARDAPAAAAAEWRARVTSPLAAHVRPVVARGRSVSAPGVTYDDARGVLTSMTLIQSRTMEQVREERADVVAGRANVPHVAADTQLGYLVGAARGRTTVVAHGRPGSPTTPTARSPTSELHVVEDEDAHQVQGAARPSPRRPSTPLQVRDKGMEAEPGDGVAARADAWQRIVALRQQLNAPSLPAPVAPKHKPIPRESIERGGLGASPAVRPRPQLSPSPIHRVGVAAHAAPVARPHAAPQLPPRAQKLPGPPEEVVPEPEAYRPAPSPSPERRWLAGGEDDPAPTPSPRAYDTKGVSRRAGGSPKPPGSRDPVGAEGDPLGGVSPHRVLRSSSTASMAREAPPEHVVHVDDDDDDDEGDALRSSSGKVSLTGTEAKAASLSPSGTSAASPPQSRGAALRQTRSPPHLRAAQGAAFSSDAAPAAAPVFTARHGEPASKRPPFVCAPQEHDTAAPAAVPVFTARHEPAAEQHAPVRRPAAAAGTSAAPGMGSSHASRAESARAALVGRKASEEPEDGVVDAPVWHEERRGSAVSLSQLPVAPAQDAEQRSRDRSAVPLHEIDHRELHAQQQSAPALRAPSTSSSFAAAGPREPVKRGRSPRPVPAKATQSYISSPLSRKQEQGGSVTRGGAFAAAAAAQAESSSPLRYSAHGSRDASLSLCSVGGAGYGGGYLSQAPPLRSASSAPSQCMPNLQDRAGR